MGREHRLAGIEAGADDFLTKPFDSSELTARVRSLSRLKRYTDELESAESVIVSLALTVEARDAYTEGHCERLSTYAVAWAAASACPRLTWRRSAAAACSTTSARSACPTRSC